MSWQHDDTQELQLDAPVVRAALAPQPYSAVAWLMLGGLVLGALIALAATYTAATLDRPPICQEVRPHG